MTELYMDHLNAEGGISHDRFDDLAARSFRPEYEELKVIPSESSDHAYLVAKITVLTVPYPNADIVSDQVTKYVCSCSDFYYNRSAGIETDSNPTDMTMCKHCTSSFRHVKAENDEDQKSL